MRKEQDTHKQEGAEMKPGRQEKERMSLRKTHNQKSQRKWKSKMVRSERKVKELLR